MSLQVDEDISDLKDLLLTMGGCVEKAVDEVHLGLMSKSDAHFQIVEKQEAKINELHTRVDKASLRLLARQAPVAGDLRFVLSVVKINTDLERMGDQSFNILHNARELIQSANVELPGDLELMKKEVRFMVKTALDAFVRLDEGLCRQVLDHDDIVDNFRNKIVGATTEKIKQHPEKTNSYLNVIMIAKNLERLADHATNIAEEVIFISSGTDIRHGRLAP